MHDPVGFPVVHRPQQEGIACQLFHAASLLNRDAVPATPGPRAKEERR